MQRVGGKAAGFINKKFFHPSSLRNQEKLWLAQSADEIERRKQDQMDKRREEERQVEELRKQMYLAGQATKGTDMLFSSAVKGSSQHLTKDQRLAFEEQQRRKSLLKQEHAMREGRDAIEGDDVDEGCELLDNTMQQNLSEAELFASLARSGYREDVHVKGHTSVWGSWYEREDERWGFGCCKTLDRNKRCPLAPEEDEEEIKGAKKEGLILRSLVQKVFRMLVMFSACARCLGSRSWLVRQRWSWIQIRHNGITVMRWSA